MKPPNSPPYPDISDLLRRRAEGRRELAKLSFGEKITRMEALRERLAPFKALREEMRAARSRARQSATPGHGTAAEGADRSTNPIVPRTDDSEGP